MDDRQFAFAAFRLDPVSQQLWRGDELVPLRPKLFAVLHHLLEHAGRLVTREELLRAVWSTTTVSESVLRGTIRELRDTLGDEATDARFIETMPHRGYRFVAAVTTMEPARAPLPAPSASDEATHPHQPILIGRAAELARLQQSLERARHGARQVVLVSGEPGIGKTAMVDAFLASAAVSGAVRTARGQCVEHYGSGEAYLPVLEALGELCRQAGGAEIVALLSHHAPTWLAQMPALIADADLEALQRRVQGATRERMLRELAEALETLAATTTVVLVLEDLHWSDYSTLDLVSMLAQRRPPARLLLLGTYRPADVIVSGHPLKAIRQELLVHQQCEEVALRFLTDREVREYLYARFPRQQLPPQLSQAIHRSTDGNPLFMVNLVDYWLSQNVLVEHAGEWRLARPIEDVGAVPDSLRHMIEVQIERLTAEERRVLDAAAVGGIEFSTAAVAAALTEPAEEIEDRCEQLAARGQFLVSRGIDMLADRTASGRYAFVHGLYQQVLYERLAAARRARLHRRLGEWEEGAFSARAADAAAELAMHFERGQDYPRAIPYLTRAADNAMRRHAPHEAVVLLGKSVRLLEHLPESPERIQQELALLVALGVPLLMTKGYAAKDVERTYARARECCRLIGNSPQLLPALAGLFRFYFVRGDFPAARALGEQVLRLAEQTRDTVVSLAAHSLLGALLLSSGEFLAARDHLAKGIALYDPDEHRFMVSLYGDDPGVTSHSFTGLALWFLGYPDQALANAQRALRVAKQIGSAYCETFALDFVTWIHVLRREETAAQGAIDELMHIAPEQGFQFLLADSGVLRGWALAAQGMAAEGLQQVQPAIAAYAATGAVMSRPSHLTLLAKVYGELGKTDEALAALTEARAVMDRTGERTYDAETHRLRGELILARARRTARRSRVPSGAAAEAEACFHDAIQVARGQQAKSLELRAALSLCRLWREQGKRQAARDLLGGVYGWFTEGFDVPDLREAKTLLAELG